MRESQHFNLFLAEGSDIVNPLVQDVQNYEKIDEQMFKNQKAGVQNATELKNGTVHAITRVVPDAQFITFTATSNYTAGETFTVDGVQVSALTVSGEALPTGAYVINSQVLCALKGTLLTVYGVGSEVADNSLALNGHPDTYFGTKEEVDNAINTANAANGLVNEINNSLDNIEHTIVYLYESNLMTGNQTANLSRPITEFRFITFMFLFDGTIYSKTFPSEILSNNKNKQIRLVDTTLQTHYVNGVFIDEKTLVIASSQNISLFDIIGVK